MKLVYNGKVIAEITTNRSLTVKEALYASGYDISDPNDCERAYNEGFEASYIDDEGTHQIDVDNIEMVY